MAWFRLVALGAVFVAAACSSNNVSGVPCHVDADCAGLAATCQTSSCVNELCEVMPTAAGTPTSSQTAGDCMRAQCDGSGNVVDVPDGSNTPTTNTPCAMGVCTDGMPSIMLAGPGTSCGAALVCDGAGNCVGCVMGNECPGSDTTCETRTCNNDTCGFSYAGSGTALPNQVAGDCHTVVCNGSGGSDTIIDDTDVPTSTNQCLAAACTNGVPSNPPEPEGTTCGSGSGMVCDGSGDCVNCVFGSDCPGSDTECETRTCTTTVCGFSFTAAGTPTTDQTIGNCQQNQCDGSGNIVSVEDDSNTPASSACANGTCASGSAEIDYLPQDTVCETTDECDGDGNCVACGDGVLAGAEVCNGTNLDGATCTSLGDAPGTLACAADCFSYDISACTGGWIAANTSFTGTACIDGLRYVGENEPLAVCTIDNGIWRGTVDNGLVPIDDPVWANADGSAVTSLLGEGIAGFDVNGGLKFWTTNATGINFWSSTETNFTQNPVVWSTGTNQQSFPQQIVAMIAGSSNNNFLAGWDPVSGQAVVLHGNATATLCTANGQTGCAWPALITNATGVATSVTSGNDNPAQNTLDIHVVVSGTTGSGAVATNPGIYWSCDEGNSYVEDDSGIAASDKPLLWKVIADRFTFVTQTTTRTCPINSATVSQYASVMYAALLGGGSLYKTTNGGASWQLSNTGLPSNVEVFSIAIDCPATSGGKVSSSCVNDQLVYAATSAGVYKSTDGGATWQLDGLKGSVVHAVITEALHPNATLAASPNGATESGNTATFATTTQVFTINIGDTIVIEQVPVAGYNGTFTVTSVISPTQFTVTLPTSGLAASGGGGAIQFNPRVFAATDQPNGVFQTNVPVVP